MMLVKKKSLTMKDYSMNVSSNTGPLGRTFRTDKAIHAV
jgi:hypothetical protein